MMKEAIILCCGFIFLFSLFDVLSSSSYRRTVRLGEPDSMFLLSYIFFSLSFSWTVRQHEAFLIFAFLCFSIIFSVFLHLGHTGL